MVIHDFKRQRKIHREGSKLVSLTPIYNEDLNKYNAFFKLYNQLKVMSEEFPQERIAIEMHNVPPDQFRFLKDEIGLGDAFTDHGSKFFFQVNINCMMIVFEQY